MKVLDFQQHVEDLAKFMESAGAKAVATELLLIRDALVPFREEPLKAFSDFLIRAKGYADGGEVPIKASSARAPRAAKAPVAKAAAVDIPALSAETKALYDTVASESVTIEHIEAMITKITPLAKDGLVTIATDLGMVGMRSKTKPVIIQGIKERFMSRKEATQRANMTNRNDL